MSEEQELGLEVEPEYCEECGEELDECVCADDSDAHLDDPRHGQAEEINRKGEW